MKILLVSEDLPVAHLGGAGKHAVLLGNTLAEAGHQVEMLGRLRAAGVVGNNDFDGPLHADIDLRGTGWQEYRFGAFLPGRREHAARRVWAAVRRLGVERFDVIHYHGHLNALGALVPAAVPFVQTLHDQGSECLMLTRFPDGAPCRATDARECAGCAAPRPNALQRWLSAAAVRRLRHRSALAFARHQTVFVSAFLRDRFVANAQPALPLRAQVVHNFTSAARLRAALATPLPAPEGKPVVLMVGRIDAAKGFGAFLDAVPDTLLQRWAWRVVGDGPQLPELRARHAPRGVQFAGFMAQADTYRETAAAAVCVVPSVWDEPCGTTLLEALALGRPTLALRRGGSAELAVYERFPGQLLLADDVAGLVARLAAVAPAAASISTVDDGADVHRQLPALERIYRAAGHGQQGDR
ncbi:MAG: glycosyltransferase family 4 protein [Bacteroidia bacterium]|jgi:glycosyltransferase involved in cell wall biosynthesis